MVRAELKRFVDSLDPALVSDDEWRFLNIINDNLDSILPLGVAAGRRSRFIVQKAYPDFESLPVQAPETAQDASTAVQRLNRLDSLRVGPFRGFAREETFDLNSEVVLLYGPNGAGKSSFCEALELALLGTVNECSEKRIEANEYLKNARSGAFEPPKLTARTESGEPEDVIPDNEFFRFCFVEKNRIDDFSRIASFTPNQQEKLIASLFGFHEFDLFVGNFNESLESYLPQESAAAWELQELETSLAGDQQIVNNKDEALNELDRQEDQLARSFSEGMDYLTFTQAVGTAEGGPIKDLTDQLGRPLNTKIGAIKTGLVDALEGVRLSWAARSALQGARLERANDLSYRNLYSSVLALEAGSPGACPACDTPLSGEQSVATNPYEKARAGLAGLTELAEIERQIEGSTGQLRTRATGLTAQLANLEANLDESERTNPLAAALTEALTAGREDATGTWWHSLFRLADEEASEAREFIYRCVERMELQDEFMARQERARDAIRGELDRLTAFRESIVERTTRRADVQNRIQRAEAALQDAEARILDAQQKFAAELSANEVRRRIVDAYSRLLSRLQGYRESLPATLLANLGQSVVTLYNAFNRGDPAGDLIADIKLPLKSGERISFSYASAPVNYFDALHVLSEGHIRCLGLAILLAKNLQTGCPVLILDDPVNAIDDDHREGIRLTLFEDPYFAGRQIVLTCHGEEFTKDIQNLVGVTSAAAKCKSYTLLPHAGDNQIRVEVLATKNHILSARNKLARNELRESLTDARRGLEWAANTIWKKILPAAGVRALSVQLTRPGAKPELMNVVQSLLKVMGENSFMSPKKAELVAGLERILGLNQNGREWDYLNKGVHEEEDRGEFDRGVVRTVVEALESLDAAISASRPPQPQPA
jgi:energy-coupling factor transporter ATP-binding protein EcfA2